MNPPLTNIPSYARFSREDSARPKTKPSSPIIRLLVIALFTLGGVKLKLSALDRDQDESLARMTLGSPLQIIFRIRESSVRNSITSRMCCSVSLSNVQSLHVQVNPPSSPAFWMRVLGHHQDLRHIKLSNGYMPDLLVASLLSIHPRDHTESQGG